MRHNWYYIFFQVTHCVFLAAANLEQSLPAALNILLVFIHNNSTGVVLAPTMEMCAHSPDAFQLQYFSPYLKKCKVAYFEVRLLHSGSVVPVLARTKRKGDPHALSLEMQTCTVSAEKSMVITQEIKNRTAILPSNSASGSYPMKIKSLI